MWRARALRSLALAPLLLGCAVIVELAVSPASTWFTLLVGRNAALCVTAIPVLSALPAWSSDDRASARRAGEAATRGCDRRARQPARFGASLYATFLPRGQPAVRCHVVFAGASARSRRRAALVRSLAAVVAARSAFNSCFELRDARVALRQRCLDILASKRRGMCCGQLASQALTWNTMACSGRARYPSGISRPSNAASDPRLARCPRSSRGAARRSR